MHSFEAEALILAGTPTVWDILTDAGNYAVWESGIVAAHGDMVSGGRIRVQTRERSRKSLSVLVGLSEGKSMTWTYGLPLRLARVVRTFTLTDYSGVTYLAVKEKVTGPLRRLVHKSGPDASEALADFVEAVRFRAELLSFHLDGGVFPAAAPTGTSQRHGRQAPPFTVRSLQQSNFGR
ncbi:SRPBCC family protein [Arthrobacter liuii]|uniref:Polyketide cyclase / dehydrase and lipid transport n=1 Tax=Arthrobacter liuii TaxID=1476996 RepID=A0ABQ2AJL5_9MICC|nr:SRPBCC family protein [Arthrobacter liuii]GGH91293.1 hypothetical protein GCM10007170_07110 [Arthrobacter liuii]